MTREKKRKGTDSGYESPDGEMKGADSVYTTTDRRTDDAPATKEAAVCALLHYNYSPFRMGTERITELMNLMGNPQDRVPCIHVAGTNGKGSACAMMASILKSAGKKVGVFTSPYLLDFAEQIRIGEPLPGNESGAQGRSAEDGYASNEHTSCARGRSGADAFEDGNNGFSGSGLMPGFREIPDGCLISLARKVLYYSEQMKDHPSTFEMTVAIAFQYFLEEKCDCAVIETGLGGLLDATNVIRRPALCLLMKIGLEHTDYLGNTLEEIAAHKAGILREGCPAAALHGPAEVEEVFRKKAAECHAELVFASPSDFSEECGESGFRPGLQGLNQRENASVVVAGVSLLRKQGWNIPDGAVREGLLNARVACRFETVSSDPLFIVDGAHNPQCTESLAENLRAYYPGRKFTIIMGVLADKDYRAMLRTILPFADRFVTLTPDNPRALSATSLAEILHEMGQEACAASSYEEALHLAFEDRNPVCAFGSLYMAGRLRRAYYESSDRTSLHRRSWTGRLTDGEHSKTSSQRCCPKEPEDSPEAETAG